MTKFRVTIRIEEVDHWYKDKPVMIQVSKYEKNIEFHLAAT